METSRTNVSSVAVLRMGHVPERRQRCVKNMATVRETPKNKKRNSVTLEVHYFSYEAFRYGVRNLTDELFEFEAVCNVIGADASAVRIRRRNGLIIGSQPGDPEAIIGPQGKGPGKGLAMLIDGALQLAIAEPLINAGIAVDAAYRIAFRFVHIGEAKAFIGEPKPDPLTDRSPGRLFEIGRTWLVVYLDTKGWPGEESHQYLSDANPQWSNGGQSACINSVTLLVGKPADGKPRILLNISDVCRNLAERLGISFEQTFKPEVK